MMLTQTLALLRDHGVRLRKRSGQHQVIDRALLERMIEHAELSEDDVVLEIGAGIGNLTLLLARRGVKVIAIEKDKRLMAVMRKRLKNQKNVKLMCGDVLRIQLPEFNKVVANLPYGISSEITFRLLEHGFELAVLMYQKEFAQRLVASPGSEHYGRLTVNVHYRASVEVLEEVPPSAFFPEPKVTSSIVKMKPRDPPFDVLDERMFFSVVRGLFQHRRQRVRNALYRSFGGIFPKTTMSKTERRAFIDGKLPRELAEARVVDLEPEKFATIANLLISP